jgi:NAD(P)-dependent dehydrogenase (short-subunit alcohol dehydrogenase family)
MTAPIRIDEVEDSGVELDGRTAVVTGGASGMGLALVEQLRAAGSRVVVWDRAPGADVTCDISDSAAVQEAMARTVELAGVPTVFTCCAAIGESGPLLELEPELWDRVLAVNLRGSWLSMRAAARAMIEAGEPGSIIAFSSISGRLSDRGMGPYCASKAAVDMLVKVAAAEWGHHGIRVNAIAPGVTDTPMLAPAARIPGWRDAVQGRTALGRLGQAHEVAQAAVGLHRMDWVTGESLAADGGLRLHSPIDTFGAAQALQRKRQSGPHESV